MREFAVTTEDVQRGTGDRGKRTVGIGIPLLTVLTVGGNSLAVYLGALTISAISSDDTDNSFRELAGPAGAEIGALAGLITCSFYLIVLCCYCLATSLQKATIGTAQLLTAWRNEDRVKDHIIPYVALSCLFLPILWSATYLSASGLMGGEDWAQEAVASSGVTAVGILLVVCLGSALFRVGSCCLSHCSSSRCNFFLSNIRSSNHHGLVDQDNLGSDYKTVLSQNTTDGDAGDIGPTVSHTNRL